MDYIKTNADKVAKNLRKLTKVIRKEAIDKALDVPFSKDTSVIKKRLKSLVKEAVIQKPQDATLPVELQDQPKAKNQLIKEIFNYDIADNHFKGKFHSDLNDKVMMLYKDRNKDTGYGGNPASRGRLKISTEQFGSYEEQLSAARSYFNKATYVVQENGEQRVYMNTGEVDMSDCVKVVCSQVGTSNPEHETPTRARFDRASQQGEVEWTLFQDCVEKKIKGGDGFTEVTEMLEDLVEGDYGTAKDRVEEVKDPKTKEDLSNKIDDIAEGTKVEPETEALTKATRSIDNIKVTKEVKKDRTEYKVTGDFDSVGEAVSHTINIALREIKLWAETGKAVWADSISKELSKVIKDFWK